MPSLFNKASNTPDTANNEQLFTQMVFTHVALDPQCSQLIEYLEAERRAVASVLADPKVRREPALLQSYVGEFIAYDELLMNIYDRMAPDIAKVRERQSFLSGCKKFFKSLLTKRMKHINTQES